MAQRRPPGRTRPAEPPAAAAFRVRPAPVDMPFLFAVLLLVCAGLVMLLSASMYEGLARDDEPLYFFLKQGLFVALGVAAATLAGIWNLRVFDRPRFGIFLYVAGLGLLALVLVLGGVFGGARRWFSLGPIQVQPTEVCKILLIFCFAIYYSRLDRLRAEGRLERRTPFGTLMYAAWAEVLKPVALLLPALVLVAAEPHFSGIAILTIVAGCMVLMSGARARSIAVGLAVLALVALVAIAALALLLPALVPVLPESLQKYANLGYVQDRLDIFFHPEEVSEDLKLQMTQAVQALGAGGLTGVGFGLGRQKFGYLPMSYNDYIFAIIGEELGFLGAIAVVALFLFVLLRGLLIARRAGSTYGYLLAGGATVLLVVQALLHIGVSTNSIPPTGISLPFFSYGGSSNTFFLLAAGIVLSVSRTPRSGPAAPRAEVRK